MKLMCLIYTGTFVIVWWNEFKRSRIPHNLFLKKIYVLLVKKHDMKGKGKAYLYDSRFNMVPQEYLISNEHLYGKLISFIYPPWKHDNVSVWCDMCACGLLFQWCIKLQLSVSV